MKRRPENEEKELALLLSQAIYEKNVEEDQLRPGLEALLETNGRVAPAPLQQKDYVNSKWIGIWKQTIQNGQNVYLRDERFSDEFVYWADVPKIESKSDRFRVVLLGESVARGWPVDPGYNPAMSLKQILGAAGEQMDIIDLARTNGSIFELPELIEASLDLQPDALIVFAGNNWIINCQRKLTANHELVSAVTQQIAAGDYQKLKEEIQDSVELEVNVLFEFIGKISRKYNLPTFFINPEFNLKDWRSNYQERLPLFNAENRTEWYRTCEAANAALKKGELPEVMALAERLIALYPSNPFGHELKAECSFRQGNMDSARRSFQEALATKIYQTSCPGMTAGLQELVRTLCDKHNVFVVDLPLIFQQYQAEDIPGRELFLDYCHLTVRGINIAMYALSRELLPVLSGKEFLLPLDDVIDLGHDSVNDAKSHFLAAIHNAHWGQDFEIIRYHCRKALSYHNIADYMLSYIKAMNSTCPGRLNKDFGHLVESGIFSTYILLTLQSDGTEAFNEVLYGAVLEALEEHGLHEKEELCKSRNEEHCKGVDRVDILRPCYHDGYRYNLSSRITKTAYYREYYKYSHFRLIAAEDHRKLTLEIVHRIPGNKICEIVFELNGTIFSSSASDGRWTKTTLHLPAEVIRSGINNFKIYWPLHLNTIGEEETLYEKMYQPTGEIHSADLIYGDTATVTEAAGRPKLSDMKVIILILALFLISTFEGLGQSHYVVNGQRFNIRDVNRQVSFVMKEVGVPGASIAVIDDGKIVFSNGYGYLDLHAPHLEKVNRDTKFQAASLSKSFIAFLAYKLVDEGLIQLDIPLYKYLENEKLQYDPRYKLITARMVLSHTSGIENHIYDNDKTKLEIIETPGTTYSYSGEGYVYLSNVIEKIRNKSIGQILKDEVYEPLNLKNTYTTSTGEANVNHAEAHDQFGRFMERWKNTEPFIMSHIHTTAEDYARLLIAILDYKHFSKSLLDQVLTPLARVESEMQYGPGFELCLDKSDTLVFQGGDAKGFKGLGIYSIKNKSGFVYFGNSERSEKIERKLCEITTGMNITDCFSTQYDNQYPSVASEIFKSYRESGEIKTKTLIETKYVNEIPKTFTSTDLVELVYYLKDENYGFAKYIATEFFKKCPDCDGKIVLKRWLTK